MLKDKVVVITGGAGLIGREFAGAVAAQRAIAVIADRDLAAAEAARDEIAATGAGLRTDVAVLDITDKASILRVIDALHGNYGRIDALVNSAYPRNSHYGREFFEVEYRDFCENLDLHLGGYFLASQQFAGYFRRQGYGNIVNVASIYGVAAPKFDVYAGTPMTMPVEYAAIKSGLLHLTKYMAKYLAGCNIRVNAVSPGGILDGQPPLFLDAYRGYCLNKGMLSPSDVSGTLLFLLSDFSQYVNGQNIVVDDGFTL